MTRKRNPLTVGTGDKIAIGVGLAAGVIAIIHYFAAGVGTATGSAIAKGANS